jgi:Flp pilus assembly protein TadG
MRFRKRSRSSRRRLRNESGQTLVIFVLFLPVLIGFAALVLDVGNWYAQKRFVQNAADAAVLAGAQDLPNTSAAQAQAQDYVTRNGGGVTNVTFPTSTKIRVTVTRNVPTYFAKIFGLSSVNVAAKAVATRFSNGAGSLTFAKSTLCQAIKINGSNSTFQGAMVSNGGFYSAPTNVGEHVIWNPATGAACLELNGGTGWAKIEESPPRDWPVPMPILSPAPPGVPTSVNGVPCTQMGGTNGKWTIGSAADIPPPGVYCAKDSIRITCDGCIINNVALISPGIFWSGKDGRITASNAILPQYGGLLFYAYGAGGLNMNGGGNSWSGGIFVPYSNAHLNGGNGAVLIGYIEADTIDIPGSNITWIGTGPAIGGSGGVGLSE